MGLTLSRKERERIVLRAGGPTGQILGTIEVREINAAHRTVKINLELPPEINIARQEVDSATVPYQKGEIRARQEPRPTE